MGTSKGIVAIWTSIISWQSTVIAVGIHTTNNQRRNENEPRRIWIIIGVGKWIVVSRWISCFTFRSSVMSITWIITSSMTVRSRTASTPRVMMTMMPRTKNKQNSEKWIIPPVSRIITVRTRWRTVMTMMTRGMVAPSGMMSSRRTRSRTTSVFNFYVWWLISFSLHTVLMTIHAFTQMFSDLWSILIMDYCVCKPL